MIYKHTFDRFLFTFLLLLLFSWGINAQNIPDGYYDKAVGLSNTSLKSALAAIIEDIDEQSYGSGTWTAFEKSDIKDDGSVWDMYSYNVRYFPGDGDAPSDMNIEHSVAQSWFSESYSPKRDLHHLFPSDSSANSRRGNYPLGTTNTAAATNEAIKVGSNTYSSDFTGYIWEPLDEYKGDFARAYLYMFTCYEDLSWTSSSSYVINSGETWPMFKDWYKEMLLEWCRLDPPSEKEINRNDVIYSIQGNRNPYIDYPELVEYLWGDLVGEAFTTDTTLPSITSPSSSSSCSFATVHYTESTTLEIEVKGVNLTSNITLSLSGTDVALFSINKTTLSAAEVNEGTVVTATFTPEVAGTYSATLSIASSEVSSTKTVTLEAEATENFIALAATNITSNSFTANWSEHSLATSYEVNLYKKTIIESQEIELVNEILDSTPDGWSTDSDGYTTYSEGVLKLASGSKDGSITTSSLDLSTESILTISAKQYNNDNSNLYIYVDNTLIASPTLTDSYDTYEINLPAATSSSTITLLAYEDKRLYIASVKVVTGGTVETLEQIENYPIPCGNVTSYTASGLNAESIYAYEITALWSNGSETTELSTIETPSYTSINKSEYSASIFARGEHGTITLYNLPIGSAIEVYNTTGNILLQHTSNTVTENFNVPQQGIYIVRIIANGSPTILKVAIK